MATADYTSNKSSSLFSIRILLFAIILTLTLAAWHITTSSQNATAASSGNKSLSIVLIGDSYTAGNGAGSYNGPWGSYQSSRNWGNTYNNWLKANGVKSTLTNLAWSGSTTQQVYEEQIKGIPQNTDLVMFTAGGNDAEFSEAVKRCFAEGFRSAALCRERVENAREELPDIILGTKKVLDELENKLPSTSEVVLVGYPLLSLEGTGYQIQACLEYDAKTDECMKWDKYYGAQAVREAGKELNKKQADMVREWNKTSSLKVTFVDTQSSFATHEPHPSTEKKNPKRWINEFFETDGDAKEDGNGIEDTKASLNLDTNNWYHPNLIGHRKIARDIINQIGVPSSAKEITPTSGDTDIVFVIDTTGSMGGAIDSVKQDVNAIATQIKNMSRSTRFSLVSFQDHPNQGLNPEDYPAKTHLNFSSDINLFTASVNSLELGFGGDWPETVYSGAMAGLDQSWRPGVRKVLIIIGDAPPHDPEPITSYTWQQVAQRAYDIDPVEIYAIDVGYGGLASPEVVQLTNQSGGKIIDASYGDIPGAIVGSVSDSLAKPFGWIQGPYVTKVGAPIELDGRGSYAVDGEINKIEWDLDGDGVFETSSADLLYTHTFTQDFGGTIGLRITDTNGNVGIGSTRLDVTDDGDAVPRNIDNCPDTANQNQTDHDGDGVGDDCDNDTGWPTGDMKGVFVTYGEEEKTAPSATPSSKDTKSSQPAPISPISKPTPFSEQGSQAFYTNFSSSSSTPAPSTQPEFSATIPQSRQNDSHERPQSQQYILIALGSLVALLAIAVTVILYRRSRG